MKTPKDQQIGIVMEWLYDSHCHLSPNSFRNDSEDLIKCIKDCSQNHKVKELALMSTNQCDILLVKKISDNNNKNDPIKIIPCFGIHPWYSHVFKFDNITKREHYTKILKGKIKKEYLFDDLLDNLPEPLQTDSFFSKIQNYITESKNQDKVIMIGEIGIDKLFRIPWSGLGNTIENLIKDDSQITASISPLSPYRVTVDHQIKMFQYQLELASKNNLPVSVHCVKAHGQLHSIIINILSNQVNLIPAICLHSYTGSLDQARIWINSQTKKNLPTTKIYFSFSDVLNSPCDHSDESKQKNGFSFEELIKFLPDDVILIETDLSIDKFFKDNGKNIDKHYEYLNKIFHNICKIKQWDLETGLRILRDNWNNFVNSGNFTK